jgi:diacylglycerol kinase family enzyme
VGGDGTVSALVNENPVVPIAVFPAGTENLFAREYKASRNPDKLANLIVHGRAKPLDLGLANGQRFSLMVGIGFDADVVTRHHHGRVAASGHIRPTNRAAYVEPVLRSSLSYKFPTLTIQVEDSGHEETLQGTTAFVFNLPCYALGLPFAPEAKGDDGWLDLIIFKEGGPFRALHYLWLVLRGLHLKRDGVYHRRIRKATITASTIVPYQLDGDPGGEIEATDTNSLNINIVPHAVEVIVA